MNRWHFAMLIRVGAVIVALGLMIHYWVGDSAGAYGGNIFVNLSIFLGVFAIWFSEVVSSEASVQLVVRIIGYIAIYGHGIGILFFRS